MKDPESQKKVTGQESRATRSDDAGTTASAGQSEEMVKRQFFDFKENRPAAVRMESAPIQYGRGSRKIRKRINTVLAVVLLLIVAVAPIPLGSNRPVYWLLWTATVLFVCGTYLSVVAIRGVRIRNPFREMPEIAISAVLFIIYSILQTAPIGAIFPEKILQLANLGGQGFISLSRDATIVASLRWTSYAVFFFLLLQVVDNRVRSRRMAWALFLIVAMHAIFGLISHRMLGDAFFWGPKTSYLGFVTGTFINRNSFATFAGFGAVIGFALLLNDLLRPRVSRTKVWLLSADGIKTVILWLCLILTLSALVATGSRMGGAATVAALFLVGFLTIRKNQSSSRRLVLTITGAMVLALVLLLATFGDLVLDRAIFSGPAWTTRSELYEQIFGLIKSKPFFGFGLDAFELAFEQVHLPPVSPDLVWGRAHSTYLAHWAEMGLFFGSLPLIICSALAVRMLITVRNKQKDYILEIAGLGVLTLAAIHSIVDFSLEISANVFVFLALLAVASPAQKKTRADTVKTEKSA